MAEPSDNSGRRQPRAKSTEAAIRRPNRRLFKVVPVRLPLDKWELISKEANDLGIGACTLARIWILDSLRKATGDNHNGNGGTPV